MTNNPKNDLRISMIQSDIYWENIEANLSTFEEKIWQIKGETDLIVLPEMFTTGFSMNVKSLAEPMNSKTLRWMKQQAAQTKAAVVGSYIIREKNAFFNRLFCVHPNGTFQYYDKRHLFGLAGENQDYSSGNVRIILDIKGWKIFPLICYDLRFPVWSRSQKSDNNLYEYDALLYVANWPKPRISSWDVLLKARAIENISYCIGVNRIGTDGVNAEYVGHSAIYDFLGEEISFSEKEEILQTVLNARKLELFRLKFPFQNDADSFEVKS